MKALKYLAILIVALCAATSCSSDSDNDNGYEKVDTVLFQSFDGYIYVTSKYIPRTYYGKQAWLGVYNAGSEIVVKFSDPQWGNAIFTKAKVGTEISATGNITINYGNKVDTYGAILSGSTLQPVISIPTIMGGCTIEFFPGEPTMANVTAGVYKGTNNVNVGGAYDYTADITYTITANPDSTINIEVPEYTLTGTIMGDLKLGAYTIENVAYDKEKDQFYQEYGKYGLSQEFTATQKGQVTMQGDYKFTDNSYIIVKRTVYGLQVENSFQLGKMPFPIVAKFESTLTAIPSGK